jgi:hypothetical protein
MNYFQTVRDYPGTKKINLVFKDGYIVEGPECLKLPYYVGDGCFLFIENNIYDTFSGPFAFVNIIIPAIATKESIERISEVYDIISNYLSANA